MTVNSELTWSLAIHVHENSKAWCSSFSDIPKINIEDVSQLLLRLDQLTVCPGHPDPHFVAMGNAKKGKFTSSSGDFAAHADQNGAVQLNGQTYT